MAEDEHPQGPASPPSGSVAKQPTINPSLAPGTAAGFAAGPSGDAAEPVDWDLWQSVVNEGPAAIARTSSEELNHAISNGIPQVIRGVIWQVLAQSKNEELENMYRELVARGTDKELMSVRSSTASNGNGKEKDSNASSSSSIHSDSSNPATTAGSTNAPLPPPSVKSDNSEDAVKSQAKLVADRKHTALEVAKLEKTIKRDLGARTSYSKYLMSAGLQDGLFGICKAYALYDEVVGYAQGMNFIAMPLLFNMPEEEAFSLFVTLMNKYGLRDLFAHDMAGLHLHLYQFERLLEDFEPALYCHLRRREVKPQLYATQWFLTLFAYRFPLQLVLRIYDLILSEGLESAILKFGIVLMQKNSEALLGMKDMATLTTFLKERIFDVYIDKAPSANSILENGFFGSTAGVDKEVYRADMLVKDAVAVKVTPETLKQYTAEWKEQQRVEKDRETELHGLRERTTHLEAIRYLKRSATDASLNGQAWQESTAVQMDTARWYASVQIMADSSIFVASGSLNGLDPTKPENNNPTYEILNADGTPRDASKNMEILVKNQPYYMYPFLHLMRDGNLFVQVAKSAEIFNVATGSVVRQFADLPGTYRTYPNTGGSVMMPLTSANNWDPDVIICGGGPYQDITAPGDPSCGRIQPLAANPAWEMDSMPEGRVMVEGTLLADGTIVWVNGGAKGAQGFGIAEAPTLEVLLYDPKQAKGKRWSTGPKSTIARLYHSVALLLLDGTLLISGSNPVEQPILTPSAQNPFVTEFRNEIYTPPYLQGNPVRPTNVQLSTKSLVANGSKFTIKFTAPANAKQVKVSLYYGGFVTHSVHMGHRMAFLDTTGFAAGATAQTISVTMPPNRNVAPPGPYVVYVLVDGVPAMGQFVSVA